MDCCVRRPNPSDGFDDGCEVVRISNSPGFDHQWWSDVSRNASHEAAASLALDGYHAKWPRAAARKGTER